LKSCDMQLKLVISNGVSILLRYAIMDIEKIIHELAVLLKNEKKTFEKARALLVVLSEGRYRIHHP